MLNYPWRVVEKHDQTQQSISRECMYMWKCIVFKASNLYKIRVGLVSALDHNVHYKEMRLCLICADGLKSILSKISITLYKRRIIRALEAHVIALYYNWLYFHNLKINVFVIRNAMEMLVLAFFSTFILLCLSWHIQFTLKQYQHHTMQ